MTRRRFFVPGEKIRDGIATLPEEQAHHLRNVLRVRPGDQVEIIDGEGNGYLGTVDISAREVRVTGLKKFGEPVAADLILAAALIKGERFEWVIQKATELGVTSIVPLQTHYSEVRLGSERIENRVQRWCRIAAEAAKQSHRLSIPRVHSPISLQQFLSSERRLDYNHVLFYERAAQSWNPASLAGTHTVVCVGPEGGWHPDEVAAAAEAGYTLYSLGNRILRADTAAVVALTLVQFRNR